VAIFFLSVWFWWQETSLEWMWESCSSLNNDLLLFLWRPCSQVLLRSAGISTAKFTVKLPWWWGDGDEAKEAFFNKRWLYLLRCGGVMLLLLLSFSGHGGSDWVWKVATPYGIGGVWGDPLDHELIQARGHSCLGYFMPTWRRRFNLR
jgi:hypothetical protein